MHSRAFFNDRQEINYVHKGRHSKKFFKKKKKKKKKNEIQEKKLKIVV